MLSQGSWYNHLRTPEHPIGSPGCRVLLQEELGDAFEAPGKRDEAVETYHASIASYNIALKTQPNNILVLSQKAFVLKRLGALLEASGNRDEAITIYRMTITTADAALSLNPQMTSCLRAKHIVNNS